MFSGMNLSRLTAAADSFSPREYAWANDATDSWAWFRDTGYWIQCHWGMLSLYNERNLRVISPTSLQWLHCQVLGHSRTLQELQLVEQVEGIGAATECAAECHTSIKHFVILGSTSWSSCHYWFCLIAARWPRLVLTTKLLSDWTAVAYTVRKDLRQTHIHLSSIKS